jgi:hypothetical protein
MDQLLAADLSTLSQSQLGSLRAGLAQVDVTADGIRDECGIHRDWIRRAQAGEGFQAEMPADIRQQLTDISDALYLCISDCSFIQQRVAEEEAELASLGG